MNFEKDRERPPSTAREMTNQKKLEKSLFSEEAGIVGWTMKYWFVVNVASLLLFILLFLLYFDLGGGGGGGEGGAVVVGLGRFVVVCNQNFVVKESPLS